MASFEPIASGVLVRFEPDEAAVLRNLLGELEEFLAEGPGTDPINSRLFPKVYETEDEQSSYEELVGDQLKQEKLRAIRDVRSALTADEFELAPESLHYWVVVLTDLRLAIGTRLEVTEEMMARDLDPDDPDAPALSVLHWLGWVQESLLTHISL